MDEAAAQFLRAIRGTRSQVAFARRLGYRGNPITDWEHGRRWPTAVETLRACARVGLDPAAAFGRFHAALPLVVRGTSAEIAPWLDRLRADTSILDLARRSGRSRFAVSRWLNGQAQPRLPDFFRLVDAITGRLPDLVAELVPIERVPALVARHQAARAARTAAFEEPWTEAVLRVLETRAYEALERDPSGWIAARLDVMPETERRCLALLAQAGVVKRRRGRWRSTGTLTVDTTASDAAMGDLRAHWASVGVGRARAPRPGDHFAYNVISVARPDLDRIRELLRATFREIRALVAASEPVEVAALVTMQLVGFDG